jgi:hypothetical protein
MQSPRGPLAVSTNIAVAIETSCELTIRCACRQNSTDANNHPSRAALSLSRRGLERNSSPVAAMSTSPTVRTQSLQPTVRTQSLQPTVRTQSLHKPRLKRLDQVFADRPLYFVTACVQGRRCILANQRVHERFREFCCAGLKRGFSPGASC